MFNVHRVSAILITDHRSPDNTQAIGGGGRPQGQLPGRSLACVEVMGRSVLERTVARLQTSGIEKISVIGDSTSILRDSRDVKMATPTTLNSCWAAAARELAKRAKRGIDTVLLAELGAYVEVDLAAAVQFHHAKNQPATPLYDTRGQLHWWIVNPREVAALSLPLVEHEMATPPAPYFVDGYTNRLADARDLRRLIVDSFLGHCAIVPRGKEIRPGIWTDEGVRVDKQARLVAPAYLGRNTRVQPAAVVGRFSNLERDCLVGEGSVVANASILPRTTIGRGLDVSSALVEGGELVDLSRNVRLRIDDPHLISGAVPVAAYGSGMRELEALDTRQLPETEYSYLLRAAGRLLEVFKGEV